MRRAAHRQEDASPVGALTRTVLWWGLGFLWLVDGLLSLQPHMPMDQLDIILMGGWDQPAWYLNFLSNHVVTWIYQNHWAGYLDGLVLAIQLGLAGAFWLGRERRWGRAALYVSLGWALVVWVLAEWMGSLFAGMSFLTNGPGSVVLYAYGAVLLLWPASRFGSARFLRRLRQTLGGWWILAAMLQALPGWWAPGALAEQIRANLVLTPVSDRTAPIAWAVRMAGLHPVAGNLVVVMLMLAVGLGIVLRPDHRGTMLAALLWFAAVWWVGENLGGLFGGVSTDPNTGPVWMLLAVALWAPLWVGARGARPAVAGDPGDPASSAPLAAR